MSISLVREHTELLKPPRALWVPFPFGLALGHPADAGQQRRVLLAALDLLDAEVPVLAELAGEDEGDDPATPVQASAVALSVPGAMGHQTGDVAAEVSMMRRYHERWVARTGRTAVGLTEVPPQRFRGLVRFLEAYARGEDADARERPPHVSVPYFARYAIDDLKALYIEARFVMRPDDDADAVYRWLWGDTVLSVLVRAVGDRMASSDDRVTRGIAYGIVR